MAVPDLSSLELYPLVTDRGQLIPLELVRPLGSFMMLADETPVVDLVQAGQMLSIHALQLTRLLTTADPNQTLADSYVPGSIYLPANSNVILQVQGNRLIASSANGTGLIYISVVTIWRSMANQRDMSYG